jgi:uncharacterized protein (TIGR02118 family)
MMKLTVLYGPPTDTAAFDQHYQDVHAPLAQKIPGISRFEAGKVTTLDGSDSPYYLMAQLWFEDMAAFGAGMGSPEGAAAAADVPTFATGGATMLLTEVE